jgi:uncharacterized protein
MISLDGIGVTHDALRPCKKAGVSSFTALARTIDLILLPRGLQPHLSMTITQQNAHSAAETTRWALKRGLRLSLNFYRQNTRNGGEIKLDLEEQTIIEGMQKAYAVYEELLPEKPFINDLLDRVQSGIHLQTCGVGNAYVVISHDGNIAQCQMCLEKAAPLTNGESLLTGIQKGEIKNLVVDEKTGCKDCLFRYRCTGGCPLETYRLTGRWDASSPHCNIYRTLFPEALRLEGLRLLKVNGYLH